FGRSSIARTPSGSARPCDRTRVRSPSDYPARLGLDPAVSPYRRGRALLLGVAFLSFVSLGLPDGGLGVAWPSGRATCGLPVGHLGVLLIDAMLRGDIGRYRGA